MGGGTKMMSGKQSLTDTDAGTNGLRMKVVTGKTPDASGNTHGPFILESDGYSDCRFTDRQAFLRVESPFDQEWRFGEVRFEAAASGKRGRHKSHYRTLRWNMNRSICMTFLR